MVTEFNSNNQSGDVGPSSLNKAVIGWILYDDKCGICRRWVPFWGDTLASLGIDTAPLQSPWVGEATKLSEKDLETDILLLLKDGELIRGPEVYRFAMKRIYWAWPLYFLSILPIFRQIFDYSYKTFARNRIRISQACSLR